MIASADERRAVRFLHNALASDSFSYHTGLYADWSGSMRESLLLQRRTRSVLWPGWLSLESCPE